MLKTICKPFSITQRFTQNGVLKSTDKEARQHHHLDQRKSNVKEAFCAVSLWEKFNKKIMSLFFFVGIWSWLADKLSFHP
jgi:hypothetical protein